MKTFIQIREELSNLTEASGEYGFGYEKPSNDAAKKGLKAIHSTAGMKINHGHDETGNTHGSKPHKNPDATVHYERGDTPHRDGASGVTLHSAKAKAHLAAKHFQSAHKHADAEDSEGEVL